MKRMLACLLLLGLSMGCATLDRHDGEAAWADLQVMEDVELVVHGLSCPLCASNLDQQVLSVPGVQDMWVDLQTGYVQIEIEPGSTVAADDLAQAVRNAGFTLRDIRPRETEETP